MEERSSGGACTPKRARSSRPAWQEVVPLVQRPCTNRSQHIAPSQRKTRRRPLRAIPLRSDHTATARLPAGPRHEAIEVLQGYRTGSGVPDCASADRVDDVIEDEIGVLRQPGPKVAEQVLPGGALPPAPGVLRARPRAFHEHAVDVTVLNKHRETEETRSARGRRRTLRSGRDDAVARHARRASR